MSSVTRRFNPGIRRVENINNVIRHRLSQPDYNLPVHTGALNILTYTHQRDVAEWIVNQVDIQILCIRKFEKLLSDIDDIIVVHIKHPQACQLLYPGRNLRQPGITQVQLAQLVHKSHMWRDTQRIFVKPQQSQCLDS